MLIIDRFEGEFAVCCDTESDAAENISISLLPEGAKEGDVLIEKDGAYRVGALAGERRRQVLAGRLAGLFDRKRGKV